MHELPFPNFDECAKFCFFNDDCTYVSINDTTQVEVSYASKQLICYFYMDGTTQQKALGTVYKLVREKHYSWCEKSVNYWVSVKPNYQPIATSITNATAVTNCSKSVAETSLDVYVNAQGFHSYSRAWRTSSLLNITGYSYKCRMYFLKEVVEGCDSVPVFLQGDYRNVRLFFGEQYRRNGYVAVGGYVYPRSCSQLVGACSSVTFREYKHRDRYDFVYMESPPPEYVKTDVNEEFWIRNNSCTP